MLSVSLGHGFAQANILLFHALNAGGKRCQLAVESGNHALLHLVGRPGKTMAKSEHATERGRDVPVGRVAAHAGGVRGEMDGPGVPVLDADQVE